LAEPKDLILGILGASGTLAGLLLVFSGYLFAQAASFPAANTDDATIEKYTKVGRFAVWPFLGFVVATVLCVAWLIHAQECVYWICASIFLISVVATGIYGAVASYRYL
jgi:cell division protein FtsW (lipid II flippase)